jgi:phage protein
MIKGTDIILWEKDKPETVKNVLIGEPSSQDMTGFADESGLITYILAIPKGDTHSWTDKKISFFGENFRTVGYPLQGIEENMPLQWHKKVKVQRLVTNSDVTLFERDTYVKHVFKDVHYSDQRSRKYDKNGVKVSGSVCVHIFAVNNADNGYSPQVGDIIVQGGCSFGFDTASEKSISESMAQFRILYPKHSVVDSVDIQVFGTLPDYMIAAR